MAMWKGNSFMGKCRTERQGSKFPTFQLFPITLHTWQLSSSRLPALMVNLNNTQNERLQE